MCTIGPHKGLLVWELGRGSICIATPFPFLFPFEGLLSVAQMSLVPVARSVNFLYLDDSPLLSEEKFDAPRRSISIGRRRVLSSLMAKNINVTVRTSQWLSRQRMCIRAVCNGHYQPEVARQNISPLRINGDVFCHPSKSLSLSRSLSPLLSLYAKLWLEA